MDLEIIKNNYPFLSCVRYANTEYICVIQNSSDRLITFYNYGELKSSDEKRLFLEFGDIWWNESNRLVPINIFMRGQMDQFKHILKTVNKKDAEVVFGPSISLGDIIQKRIKRRQISLVRKID